MYMEDNLIIRLGSRKIMAGAILMTRVEVNGTGFYSLLTVSLVGGVAYLGAAWLFNVARIRTLSMKVLRSELFPGTVLGNKGEL